jgi:hypothetical protein
VAAGVAVLAAGAMIVAQSVSGGGGQPMPGGGSPPTSVDLAKANAELDRCYAAIQQGAKDNQFPARSQWRPVITVAFGGVHVTGARAAGKPVFCETTNTAVTFSDPRATSGAVLMTDAGTVAGVVDPSWPQPWVELTGPGGPSAGPATAREGMFVVNGGGKVGIGSPRVIADVPTGPGVGWQPLAPAPAATRVVDRPTKTRADLSTEQGRAAAECVTAAATTIGVLDGESWAPGAVLQRGADRFAMLRNDFGFSACWQTGGQPGFAAYLAAAQEVGTGPKALGSTVTIAEGTVLSGIVPPQCVRMRLSTGEDAQVSGSTFAVLLPGGVPKSATATLYDASDRVIYEGPIG